MKERDRVSGKDRGGERERERERKILGKERKREWRKKETDH